MSETIELRILGPLELLRDGVPVAIGGVKPRQLLATLALHHGRTVSVDQLIEVLWPQQVPRSAVANIRTYVSSLRAQLGADRLTRQPPGYRLQLGTDELDASVFERYAQSEELTALDAALGLWRGEPLEDLPNSSLWKPIISRLVERWRGVRQARNRQLIDAGNADATLADLRALVSEDPLREEAWLLLVTALEATGRRAEALAAYAEARRILAEELGIEPGEPLRRIHHRLLLGTVELNLARVSGLDSDAATVLRGLARLDLGPVPSWVPAVLLNRADPQPVLDNLLQARLVRCAGTVDPAGQQRFDLPALVGLLAPDLPGETDEALVNRVLAGYLALTERAAAALPAQVFGPGCKVAPRWPVPNAEELTRDPIAWFTAERATLVGAVEFAAATDRATLAWELAHAMVPWLDLGGHSTDWERTHRSALAVCRRDGQLLGEAVTLRGLGQLHLYRDHYDAADEAFSRSRLVYARLGNVGGEAGALAGLGAVRRIRGDLDAAQECYRQALASYVTIGDRHGQAYAYGALSMIWLARGEPEQAWRWLRRGLDIAIEVGDGHRVAHLTHLAGIVGLRSGDRVAAHAHLVEALDRFAALGDVHGQAYCLSDLANLEGGDAVTDRLVEALEIFERIGNRRAQAQTARRLGELYREAGRDGLGDAYLAESRRLQATVELSGTPVP